MVRALAAAAVFHGVPRLFIEDNAEEEDKGTLGVGEKAKGRESGQPQKSTCPTHLGGKPRAHLQTVEPSEQVVEDDHVAVDGEERQKTCD